MGERELGIGLDGVVIKDKKLGVNEEMRGEATMVNNDNMTKNDVAVLVARATGVKQRLVRAIIQKTFETMAVALKEGRTLEFRRFGTFEVRERAARVGRNPHLPGLDIRIPAHKIVKFRPGTALKALIGR